MAGKVSPEVKELIRLAFFKGHTQKHLAAKYKVSEQTISRWVREECWKEKRAAQSMTTRNLTGKTLLAMDKRLDKILNDDDADAKGMADELAKFRKALESFGKDESGIVDVYNVFGAFDEWLIREATTDRALRPKCCACSTIIRTAT